MPAGLLIHADLEESPAHPFIAVVVHANGFVCSTPFGVIGLFTRQWVHWGHARYSAQRRLASLDCSLLDRSRIDAAPCVLNAVWRHWIVHNSHPTPTRRQSSAQRRLASLDCSPLSRAHQGTRQQVLNAVWRHWIVHSIQPSSTETSSDVLNAVWRHWIVHVRRCRPRCAWNRCSTPFGVIGLFTDPGGGGNEEGPSAQRRLASLDCSREQGLGYWSWTRVLNAVWRHWIVH